MVNGEASKMDGREVVTCGWETYIFEEIRFIRTCVLFLKKEASLLAGIPDGAFRYVGKEMVSHNSLDVDQ